MSIQDFLKKCLMDYFIVTTCITAATGVLGLILDPDAVFGYEAFFSPLIFGFLGLLPSLVTYSARELTLRQALFRRVLQFLLLETLLISFGFFTGLLRTSFQAISFAFTVLTVYLLSGITGWILDRREADRLNLILKEFQDKKAAESFDSAAGTSL